MKLKCNKTLLFVILSLGLQQSAYAASDAFNYYQAPPSDLLQKVEKYHLQQGISQAKQGKFEYAWSEYAFMLHYFPNHPRALQLMGELSIQMEQTSRAMKYFERALSLYPDDAVTYGLYGKFLHKMGLYQDAVKQYQKAAALDNHHAEYHYDLGLAYFALKDFDKANRAAQIAYQQGISLITLKEQLIAANAWKPSKKNS
jgi:tetratricopeptide (TPR) repeat protein